MTKHLKTLARYNVIFSTLSSSLLPPHPKIEVWQHGVAWPSGAIFSSLSIQRQKQTNLKHAATTIVDYFSSTSFVHSGFVLRRRRYEILHIRSRKWKNLARKFENFDLFSVIEHSAAVMGSPYKNRVSESCNRGLPMERYYESMFFTIRI